MSDKNDEETEDDPRRLILPYVRTDTEIELWGDSSRSSRQVATYAPSVISGAMCILFVLLGSTTFALLLGGLAVCLLVVALFLDLKSSRKWYLTPKGFLQETITYRRLKRSLPWGTSSTINDSHEIRHIRPEGGVARQDYSQAALLRVEGMNTTHLSAGEIDNISTSYTNKIENTISAENRWWATYSTTRPASTETLASLREKRGKEFDSKLTDKQRERIRQSGEWLQEEDEKRKANDWRHYIVIEALPEEADINPASVSAQYDSYVNKIRGYIPGVSKNEASDEEEIDEDTADEQISELLTKRVNRIGGVINGIDQLDVKRAGPREHIEVLRSYWLDEDRKHSDESPKLLSYFEREWEDDGYTPTERMLSADYYDVDGQTIELNNEYIRTYWVSEWPIEPQPQFLSELYTMTDHDMDIKSHYTPIDHIDSTPMIENKGLDVDAKSIAKEEEGSLASLAINSKSDAYKKGYVLADDDARVWHINTYVTVRASTEKKLNEKGEEIERVLRRAGCIGSAPGDAQHRCFKSGSPFNDDIYAVSAPAPARARLGFSGAIGAMFPFGATDLDEEKGILWGRNTQTMDTIVADPFSRGTAPHVITIGMSRSGKTHFSKEALANWFLEADDRTLIVADTQSGFHDLTNTCNGKHIVIDSNQEINPLHIVPPAEGRVEEAEGKLDPLSAKIDEVSQLLLSITQAGNEGAAGRGSSGNRYKLIRFVVSETYARAGINHEIKTHSNESPTLNDFIDVLQDLRDNPEFATILGSEGERDRRVDSIDNLADSLIELVKNDDSEYSFGGEGRHANLRGEGTIELIDEDVRMAYLDLTHLKDSEDAEKSIGLQIALSQIAQKIKQAPGQTIFMIDEAHLLYQSESLVNWLQKAVREWARYEACMWSVSQSPEEFVQKMEGSGENTENKRQVIREQTSTLQVFYSNKTDYDTLKKFGLGPGAIHTVRNKLTPGRSAKDREDGFSECLIQFRDERGWIRSRVDTMPICENEKEDSEKAAEDDEEYQKNGWTNSADVTVISGIGNTYGQRLKEAEIETVGDLLETEPRKVVTITDASAGRVDEWFTNAVQQDGESERAESSEPQSTDNSEGIPATDGGTNQ